MKNNATARMVFDNAKRAIDQAYGSPESWKRFKLTQSYLRLEVALVAGVTNFQFNVLVNQAGATGIFNTEQRLNLQDTFVPAQVGFFPALAANSTDAAFPLRSYLNPFIFTNAAAMTGIYNGTFSIMVNNNNLIPAWDMWQHYHSPETQQTAAAAANSPIDEFDGCDDGMVAMEPNVALLGSKNNILTLQLRAGLTAVDANSRLVLIMRGVLAQNSTVVS